MNYIGSRHCLLPGQHQAITWTYADFINWINKIRLNLNRHGSIFSEENVFEIVTCNLVQGWGLLNRFFSVQLLYPPNNPNNEVVGGILVSVRPSVRLSRLPCPLCNIYSSWWILSILATNDHYYKRMCRTQWPLTLTYIFKVIWPWLRKSCPLCSVYSSRWILFIYGTNDHYH